MTSRRSLNQSLRSNSRCRRGGRERARAVAVALLATTVLATTALAQHSPHGQNPHAAGPNDAEGKGKDEAPTSRPADATTQPTSQPTTAPTTQPTEATEATEAPAIAELDPELSRRVEGAHSTDAQITPAEMQGHIDFLAADEMGGRYPGTPEYERAAAYVAGELARAGVLPMGDDGTYLHGFEVVTSVERVGEPRLERADGAAVPSDAVTPLAFSAEGEAQGHLVFAGYGIRDERVGWNDLEGLDLEGAVAVILMGAPEGKEDELDNHLDPRAKAGVLRDAGAAAVVLVADELPEWDGASGRIGQGIVSVVAMREPLLELLGISAEAFAEAVNALSGKGTPALAAELPVLRVDAAVDRVRVRTHNVIGWLPPNAEEAEQTNEFVVIGGHLDHLGLGGEGGYDPEERGQIHNGADDNASGIAGILEIAERHAAENGRRRGIVYVAFAAEELGLLGSSALVRESAIDLERTVAMLNMDMIGRGGDGTLHVAGVGTGDYLEGLVRESAEPYDFTLRLTASGYGASDHDSFLRAGVPVLSFFTGLHGDYHRPSDDPEKVHPVAAARVADLVAEISSWLARTTVPPELVELPTPNAGRGRGYGPYLGTRPSFEDHPEGLMIDGVTAGGPAEQAGMQAGDLVLWFDRVRVRNIYDYTRALRDRQPGETAMVLVRRGESEIRLYPVLGKR